MKRRVMAHTQEFTAITRFLLSREGIEAGILWIEGLLINAHALQSKPRTGVSRNRKYYRASPHTASDKVDGSAGGLSWAKNWRVRDAPTARQKRLGFPCHGPGRGSSGVRKAKPWGWRWGRQRLNWGMGGAIQDQRGDG